MTTSRVLLLEALTQLLTFLAVLVVHETWQGPAGKANTREGLSAGWKGGVHCRDRALVSTSRVAQECVAGPSAP